MIREGKSLILVFHKAPFLVLISSYYALMIFARVLFLILFSLICDSSGFYRNFCFSKNTFQNFYCEDSCNNDIKIRGYLYYFFTLLLFYSCTYFFSLIICTLLKCSQSKKSSVLITLVDVHRNWQNWFHFF